MSKITRFAIVILVMWRTSSWIGIDGPITGYRQRHPDLSTRFTSHGLAYEARRPARQPCASPEICEIIRTM